MIVRDGWRLAVGTLTVVPMPPPSTVDRQRTGVAMLVSPVAVLPLGLAVTLVVAGGQLVGLSTGVTGLLAVAALALGTRCLHIDGLSDVADGLTGSYDRERSLAVMHTSTSGPAGVAATLLVLGTQAAAFASIAGSSHPYRSAVVAGVAVCLSRTALLLCCSRGVPAAEVEGIGRIYTESVPRWAAVTGSLLAAVVLTAFAAWAGWPWWRGALAMLVGLAVVVVLLRRVVRRLGGVNGDVFGASIEACLAAVLVGLA